MKAVSIFLGVVAVLFYFMWLSETSLPCLPEVPQGVIDGEAPTDVVHVLDMAWILPAMVLTAIWLWRGRALGLRWPEPCSRSCRYLCWLSCP